MSNKYQKVRYNMKMQKYKVRGMAIVEAKENKNSFYTRIVRCLIECEAEGFSDWQWDGGYYHDEGELNIDWTTARAVYPDDYEIIMGSEDCQGKHTIEEIVKVFEQSVLTDDWEIEEV